MEKWVFIDNTDDMYMVSTYGRVRSVGRTTYNENGRKMSTQDKFIGSKTGGAVKVWIKYNSGKRKLVSVHKLVADAFLPEEEGKEVIVHINGDRYDNRLENLTRSSICVVNRETKRIEKVVSTKRYNRTFDEHYSIRVSTRNNFMKACRFSGKNFNDYKEVFVYKDNRSVKRYVYIKKEESNVE